MSIMNPQKPDERPEPTEEPNSDDGAYELDPQSAEDTVETPGSAAVPIDAAAETPIDQPTVPDDQHAADEIELEAEEEVVPASLTCPACRAPMPGSDQVVCLACGYDLVSNTRLGDAKTEKTEKKDKSKHGGDRFAIADSEEGASEGDAGAIMPRSNHRLWSIIAVVAAVVMMFALIAGWSSLFPSKDGLFRNSDGLFTLDAPSVKVRLLAAIQFLVASAVVIGCGMVALRLAAWLERRPLGSVIGILSRITAIVAVAALARLIPIESGWLQTMTHLLVGVGAVVGGSMLLLNIRDRIALTHLVAWALLLLIIVPAARLVAWAMPLG